MTDYALAEGRYEALVDEFDSATDVHERYLLRSLVTWWVPPPWYSLGTWRDAHSANNSKGTEPCMPSMTTVSTLS